MKTFLVSYQYPAPKRLVTIYNPYRQFLVKQWGDEYMSFVSEEQLPMFINRLKVEGCKYELVHD